MKLGSVLLIAACANPDMAAIMPVNKRVVFIV